MRGLGQTKLTWITNRKREKWINVRFCDRTHRPTLPLSQRWSGKLPPREGKDFLIWPNRLCAAEQVVSLAALSSRKSTLLTNIIHRKEYRVTGQKRLRGSEGDYWTGYGIQGLESGYAILLFSILKRISWKPFFKKTNPTKKTTLFSIINEIRVMN